MMTFALPSPPLPALLPQPRLLAFPVHFKKKSLNQLYECEKKWYDARKQKNGLAGLEDRIC
jgi:hypothetical protein